MVLILSFLYRYYSTTHAYELSACFDHQDKRLMKLPRYGDIPGTSKVQFVRSDDSISETGMLRQLNTPLYHCFTMLETKLTSSA